MFRRTNARSAGRDTANADVLRHYSSGCGTMPLSIRIAATLPSLTR